MEVGTVSVLSMVGMVVSFIIAVGLPIGLCVYLYRRKKASLSSFLTGCGVFVLFAMILEQLLHTIVLTTAGEQIMGNIFLYATYGGLAAALFEETGRFLAMKYFMKKRLDRENALMYGVGHGGAEAILLVGMTYINNLVTSVMINKGQLDTLLAPLEEGQREVVLENISALWTAPGYQFFMSGIERAFAIAMQIAFSVLVYKAVKSGQKRFLFLAMGAHFCVDFVAVIATKYIPLWAVEGLVFAMTAIGVYLAYRVYKEEDYSENGETSKDVG